MRQGRRRRGFSLLELLGAGSTATIVGGAMFLLLSGVRDVFQTQVAFNQLSGYLDVATGMLRSDIWGAAGRCDTDPATLCPPCPGCPGTTLWLGLDMGAPNPGSWADDDIRYTLDPHPGDAAVLTLVRRVRAGGAWPPNGRLIAQCMVNIPDPVDLTQPGRVGLNIQTSRTVNGRTYPRGVRGVFYRLQVQP